MTKDYRGSKIKVLDKGFTRLIDYMGDDSAVVQAARVSYGKGTKSVSEDRALIRYLMRRRHTSPFEQVEFKFHMKMPIFVARQIVRHRVASLNECSGRYSEMPNEFYVPELERIQDQSTTNKQGSGSMLDPGVAQKIVSGMEIEQGAAHHMYKEYLEGDVARELARINLPLTQYTEWYWKMDLHNLFHFLNLRMDEHSQWETRQYANAIYTLIEPIVPVSCEAFMDYVFNAHSFSAQEMEILKRAIDVLDSLENYYEVEEMIDKLPKRERKEFKKKLGM